MSEPWTQPNVVTWTQILLDSFEQRLGYELMARVDDAVEQAKRLFFAPFVIASHGAENDPLLNYGNAKALELWEMNWQEFTQTPSRLTAEPVNHEERQKMLLQVARQGFVDNYRGVRISRTGKRFIIKQAIIWNLSNVEGQFCGQAATFSQWFG